MQRLKLSANRSALTSLQSLKFIQNSIAKLDSMSNSSFRLSMVANIIGSIAYLRRHAVKLLLREFPRLRPPSNCEFHSL